MYRRFPFNREISGIKHQYHKVTLSQLRGQNSNKTTEEWKGELLFLCSQDCSALAYNAFYMAYYKAQRNTIEFSWLIRVCLECYLFLSEDWLIFLVILVWSLLAFKSNLYIQKVFPLLFTFPSNTSWFSTLFIRPHTFPQLLYLRANTFDMDAHLQCGIAVSPRCCTIIAGIYAIVQWGYFSKYCWDSIQ